MFKLAEKRYNQIKTFCKEHHDVDLPDFELLKMTDDKMIYSENGVEIEADNHPEIYIKIRNEKMFGVYSCGFDRLCIWTYPGENESLYDAYQVINESVYKHFGFNLPLHIPEEDYNIVDFHIHVEAYGNLARAEIMRDGKEVLEVMKYVDHPHLIEIESM